MKLPEKLSDRVVFSVFSVVFLGGLISVIVNPFGNIFALRLPGLGVGRLHNITFLCGTMLFLWFWSKNVEIPFFKRFFLTGLFIWLSYQTYDIVWETDRMLFLPWGFSWVDFFGRLTVSFLIPLGIFVYFTRIRGASRTLTISFKRLVLIWAINFAMILWLESTGFYLKFFDWWYGVGPDPHGWVWFIGKAVGLLSWVFVVKHKEVRN